MDAVFVVFILMGEKPSTQDIILIVEDIEKVK